MSGDLEEWKRSSGSRRRLRSKQAGKQEECKGEGEAG